MKKSVLSAPHFLWQQIRNERVALLFEPALDERGTVVVARKGSGKFSLHITGKAAHAGRNFREEKNAIVAMAKLINQIEKFNDKGNEVTFNVAPF